MRIPAKELGRRGETRAEWFYRMRGYRVVGRNVRLNAGEIDIVLRRGRLLVVAEVKTRQSLAAGEGFEAVNREKRQRLVRLADQYLVATKARDLRIRYDILSLFWNGRSFEVRHFPDAFRPLSDPLRPWEWIV